MRITVRLSPSCAAGAIALAIVVANIGVSPVAAQSPQRGSGYGYAPQYVVAESEWGNGVVRGAVRSGRHGLQVRLPRGTWIDCVRSCSDTLRRQTVDFWESNGPNAPGSGRGYFKWDFRF
jgi:hypothetical protein